MHSDTPNPARKERGGNKRGGRCISCMNQLYCFSLFRKKNPPKKSLLQVSSEIQQHQETKPNKDAQDNAVPPFLRSDPPNQTVDPRHLARGADHPPIDARQRLPLHAEAFLHRIGRAQHPVHHAVAVVDPPPLVQHVFLLRGGRVRVAVRGDVGPHAREQVRPVPGLDDAGSQPPILVSMVEQDLAVSRQVVLFQR